MEALNRRKCARIQNPLPLKLVIGHLKKLEFYLFYWQKFVTALNAIRYTKHIFK